MKHSSPVRLHPRATSSARTAKNQNRRRSVTETRGENHNESPQFIETRPSPEFWFPPPAPVRDPSPASRPPPPPHDGDDDVLHDEELQTSSRPEEHELLRKTPRLLHPPPSVSSLLPLGSRAARGEELEC
ncbi:hypothetical protein EYF80_058693 [Liparis tanakae]|uniref:Uncharacterized protein n=1 Tax=Liparis tanakae TaxID=230148 RepID=A0A4Z2EQQ6_9TELE|nr:hypothetical protein EYF80_058693 [Liparis tanakae]